ncbi:hypothetical protein BC828DRAFT_416339 [Blastocladiella britannica]|nr:hypothetical protein BC828DRAFT_416339 [Blastocladiella britannica]
MSTAPLPPTTTIVIPHPQQLRSLPAAMPSPPFTSSPGYLHSQHPHDGLTAPHHPRRGRSPPPGATTTGLPPLPCSPHVALLAHAPEPLQPAVLLSDGSVRSLPSSSAASALASALSSSCPGSGSGRSSRLLPRSSASMNDSLAPRTAGAAVAAAAATAAGSVALASRKRALRPAMSLELDLSSSSPPALPSSCPVDGIENTAADLTDPLDSGRAPAKRRRTAVAAPPPPTTPPRRVTRARIRAAAVAGGTPPPPPTLQPPQQSTVLPRSATAPLPSPCKSTPARPPPMAAGLYGEPPLTTAANAVPVTLDTLVSAGILNNRVLSRYLPQKAWRLALAMCSRQLFLAVIPSVWADPWDLQRAPADAGARAAAAADDAVLMPLLHVPPAAAAAANPGGPAVAYDEFDASPASSQDSNGSSCGNNGVVDAVTMRDYAAWVNTVPASCVSAVWAMRAGGDPVRSTAEAMPTQEEEKAAAVHQQRSDDNSGLTVQLALDVASERARGRVLVPLTDAHDPEYIATRPPVTSLVLDATAAKYRRLFSAPFWSFVMREFPHVVRMHIDAAEALLPLMRGSIAETAATWPHRLQHLSVTMRAVTRERSADLATVLARTPNLVSLDLVCNAAVPVAELEPLRFVGRGLPCVSRVRFIPPDDAMCTSGQLDAFVADFFDAFPAKSYRHLELYPETEYAHMHFYWSLGVHPDEEEEEEEEVDDVHALADQTVGGGDDDEDDDTDELLSPPRPWPSVPSSSSSKASSSKSGRCPAPRIDRLTLWLPHVTGGLTWHAAPLVARYGSTLQQLDLASCTQHPRAGRGGYPAAMLFEGIDTPAGARFPRTAGGCLWNAAFATQLVTTAQSLHTLHLPPLAIGPGLADLALLAKLPALHHLTLALAPPFMVNEPPAAVTAASARRPSGMATMGPPPANSTVARSIARRVAHYATYAYMARTMRALLARAPAMRSCSWMSLPLAAGEDNVLQQDQNAFVGASVGPSGGATVLGAIGLVMQYDERADGAWALCSVGAFGCATIRRVAAQPSPGVSGKRGLTRRSTL